ncbi:hypothetical protein A2344_04905 [Candidatus Peregrinibacteria bacterium RIFOXYB12_FULL_41_12]|nr:MAG: hypothetical protein A2344_04905 [Candidatus Peregrinibacteria bacterium RIFOXYB12_FULL_41_12]OGJ48703.1 MAG: hypothetical protein A2244_03330 [Candidatus Peregrinibacteria bacterium RIFOXYA2_FULL_41_18]OGJ52741.1 MAG: hypothetical protein A2336_00415 [Candidatus Peregrinibacteria bacterium RIFOXYB2_FULL_41_88]
MIHPAVIAEMSRTENVVASVLAMGEELRICGHLYNAKKRFYYTKETFLSFSPVIRIKVVHDKNVSLILS